MYRDSAKSPEPTYDDKWNTMEYMYRDSAKSPEPTYDDKWNTMEYMYRDSAKSPEPTYDDKWNTMERSNAWFVNPIHEQYECGANELASALQDTAIANAGQQKLYEDVDNY